MNPSASSSAFPQSCFQRRRLNRGFRSRRGTQTLDARRLEKQTVSPMVHVGCLNSVNWSPSGHFLASAGDDLELVIWRLDENRTLGPRMIVKTQHRSNIFSAKFMWGDDVRVATASRDASIKIFDVHQGRQIMCFDDLNRFHSLEVQELVTPAGEPSVLLSGGADGSIRTFDLRVNMASPSQGHILTSFIDRGQRGGVNSIAGPEARPEWVAACGEAGAAKLYDRRKAGKGKSPCLVDFRCPSGRRGRQRRDACGTGVDFSRDGKRLAVSFLADNVFLFDAERSWEHACEVVERRALEEDTARSGGGGEGENPGGDERRESSEEEGRAKRRRSVPQNIDDLSSGTSIDIPTILMNGRTVAEIKEMWEKERQRLASELQQDNQDVTGVFEVGGVIEEKSQEVTMETEPDEDAEMKEVERSSSELIDALRNFQKNFDEYFRPPGSEQMGEETMSNEVTRDKMRQVKASFYTSLAKIAQLQTAIGVRNLQGPEKARIMQQAQEFFRVRQRFLEGPGSDETREAVSLRKLVNWIGNGVQAFVDEVLHDVLEPAPLPPLPSLSDPREGMSAADFESEQSSCSESDEESEASEADDPSLVSAPLALPYTASYYGHRNIMTVKEVAFVGLKDEFVATGSDCGSLFVWKLPTDGRKGGGTGPSFHGSAVGERGVTEGNPSELGNLHPLAVFVGSGGDTSVLNSISQHPFKPFIATSGIDNTVKLWTPSRKVEANVRTDRSVRRLVEQNGEEVRRFLLHETVML